MPDQETIDQQLALLTTHRRTLAHLVEQAAQFGGEVFAPPQTANGIAEARQQIRHIKAYLRKNGAQVEDAPNDKAPRRRKPAKPPQAGDVVGGDKVMGNRLINIVQPLLAPALHQLRDSVSDFVGREREIDQLVQALTTTATSGTAAAISGVRGMGGIGKTELAYVVANQLKDAFPDAQIVVELRGASSPITSEQALQSIIRAFEREAKLPDDVGQLKGIYNSVLAGKRVLVLADDAKDAGQVRPLLPPPGCVLLVTSRNRFSLPGMATLDLGMLPSGNAEELLLEICPRIGKRAGELAELCGYLPLALRVSASLLRENDSREVEHYLGQLRVERLKYLKDPDNPDDPQTSVEASLQLSYNTLEPLAQNTLHQVSVIRSSFGISLAQAVIVLEHQNDVEDILILLRRRNLLEWSQEKSRYSMHDLVRTFAFSHISTQEAYIIRSRYIEVIKSPIKSKNLLEPGKIRLSLITAHWRHAVYHYSLFEHPYLQNESVSRKFLEELPQIMRAWDYMTNLGPSRPTDEILINFTNLFIFVFSHWDNNYDFQIFSTFVPLLEDGLAASKRLGQENDEKIISDNLTKMREDLRKLELLDHRRAASQHTPSADASDE